VKSLRAYSCIKGFLKNSLKNFHGKDLGRNFKIAEKFFLPKRNTFQASF
jgi:hypothetical protein